MAEAGRLLFQSKSLSLDHETACASCHLDRFGSSDGLPNAMGVGSTGQGTARMRSGGAVIPRNTLPFWGRGGKGFTTFFWDGKVDGSSGTILSQFAGREPSQDPLVVAVHLPPVEIDEMVADTAEHSTLEGESVGSAAKVFDALAERVRSLSSLADPLAAATAKPVEKLDFKDMAEAIAAFIRQNFAIGTTRLHRFVFDGGPLSPQEIAGGLLFYGKAHCSACHDGPYFSDMSFHAVPFPQAGFGKNGFGIDYGRYNVTMDPADLYRFRTPPLYNVTKTAPYSHSGAIADLGDAIRAHVDPLAIYDPRSMTGVQRADFYERLKAWSSEPISGVYLADDEIRDLEAFLKTLEYDSREPVAETD
ncbi:methylamine utilization protein MauG [Jiella endophytica]|uniref:Methylamine utilization protein MauG n=2 Tax=Jiella endophytica TaxID=2558362 RepID=A0A4Y8RD67_9HYPH|nr:methylamine utilization protein MauG [Jiella endophytica]